MQSVAQKFPYAVMLDNVRSAHNVGAIFRTCDGAGASKLYLTGITPYPPHNKIPKTALGSIEFVNWQREIDGVELCKQLKAAGATLVAVEQTDSAEQYDSYDYPENTILIFGHEITGVTSEILELADTHVYVPMFGQKNSLNVATTVGILSYHVALNLQRKGIYA